MRQSMLEVGRPGRHRHFAQTELERRPFTNCTGFAFMIGIEFGGAHIDDPEEFIRVGRRETGVAEVADGETQGTSVGDWQLVVARSFPWVIIDSGWMEASVLLRAMERRQLAGIIGVKYDVLPTKQRRFSPRFDGSHRGTLLGARRKDGIWEVLWDDPLGPSDYDGEWVAWVDIRKAMAANGQTDGSEVWLGTIAKGAALGTLIRDVTVYEPPATVAVPKGTPMWELDEDRLRLTAAKTTQQASKSTTRRILRVTTMPKDPPTGPMVQLASGGNAGLICRLSDVKVTPPPPPDPGDDRYQEGVADGRALEAALYLPSEECSSHLIRRPA